MSISNIHPLLDDLSLRIAFEVTARTLNSTTRPPAFAHVFSILQCTA
jgi:hypothetical protein